MRSDIANGPELIMAVEYIVMAYLYLLMIL